MRGVTDRSLPRPRSTRRGPPSSDVTPDHRQLTRLRVRAGAGPAHASDARSAADGGGGGAGDVRGAGSVSGVGSAGRRSQPRRGAHRGRRSYDRKRGPRRHRRSWTGIDEGLLKISALNIQSLKPKISELTQVVTFGCAALVAFLIRTCCASWTRCAECTSMSASCAATVATIGVNFDAFVSICATA